MPPRAVPNRIRRYPGPARLRHDGGMRLLAPTPRRSAVALVLIAALSLVACGKSQATHWNGNGGSNTDDGGKVAVTISDPKDAASDVPASVEIVYETKNAKNATVEVTNAGTGAKVDGVPRSDGSSWVPQQALKYGTKYTAKVTATADNGTTTTATSTFTTMAEPANTSHMISADLGDGGVYGV